MQTPVRRAYASTGLGQVHYRQTGAGEPLVLLHQVPSSSAAFEPIMTRIAHRFHVIALDLPGFGMSDPPPQACQISDYAERIFAALQSMGIKRFSVFGHHTGAAIAVEIAARYPQHVAKLILNGIPYFQVSFEELAKRLPALYAPVVFRPDGSHLMDVWTAIAELIRKAHSGALNKQLLALIQSEVLAKLVSGNSHLTAYTAVFNYDIMERLPRVQAPTLLVTGELDALLANQSIAAARVGKSRSKVIPGGSFYTTYLDADSLAQAILSFFDSSSE